MSLPRPASSGPASSGPAPARPDGAARATAVLLVLGALTYSAWILEAVVRTGLDPVRSYVSELMATDQPHGDFFRASDLTSGLLILAAALTALWGGRRARPGRLVRAGWGALALFGAATVADSRLPLSCTPTADPACAAREDAGLVPFTHAAHAVSSSLAMAAAVAGMLLLTFAAHRHGVWRPLARFGPALVAVELAATVWTLAAVAAFEAGHDTWALGAGQRLQVLLVAVWLVVLAVSVVRERGERP